MAHKPHLIIVCGILYPNPSPTGLCAYRYATLLTDVFDIEFIALSSNGKGEESMYRGVPVHTLSCGRLALEHKTKGWVSKAIHLLGSSHLKLSLYGNMSWFAKSAYKMLEEIHNNNSIDTVLTVCSPLAAHIAGVKFKEKHPGIRHCAYTVDPYAANVRIVPFFHGHADFVALEKRVCANADCLLLSEEALNSRQDIYGDIPNKLALPYLLPKAPLIVGDMFDKKLIHCVYAGSFYRELRNPEFMLKVFCGLDMNDVVLHLYSAGCEDIVSKYSSDNKRIEAKGYVKQEELQKIYASCDFLIGVGNAANDFLPSKTFEYLSLRRPIVFFNPKGFGNNALQKYPQSLQLSDDLQVEEAVVKLKAFIEREKGKTISEEELNKLYSNNTAMNVRNILLKGLKKSCTNG